MEELLPTRQDIIDLCQNAVMSVLDPTADKEKLKNLEDEIDRDYEKLTALLRSSGRTSDATEKENDIAIQKYELKKDKAQRLKEEIAAKEDRQFNVSFFMKRLETITEVKFSEEHWCSLVDYVSVPEGDERKLIFHLRYGEVMENILLQNN